MNFSIKSLLLQWVFGVPMLFFYQGFLQAQQDCSQTFEMGQGYSTTILDVVLNSNGSHTITLLVENDGCAGCSKLNRYSVEAAPGTYSDIGVEVISGPFTYANIGLGPNLGGDPFQGFRINNTNGMGNGQASSFAITYTLTGACKIKNFLREPEIAT